MKKVFLESDYNVKNLTIPQIKADGDNLIFGWELYLSRHIIPNSTEFLKKELEIQEYLSNLFIMFKQTDQKICL